MDKILALYDELNSDGVKFFHWNMGGDMASTIEIGGRYAIFMDFDSIPTSSDELVLIAHEGGHIRTGTTHKVCSPFDLVEKHEYKANKWAVKRLIPEFELDEAIASGCTDIYSLAEHFNVTEDFMKMAVCWYTYGNLAVDLYF